MNEVAALREELEIVKEVNLQLKAQSHGLPDEVFVQRARRLFHITALSARLLQVLVEKGELSKESLFFALYSDKIDQPELKIVDVLLCKIRKGISPFGVKVETVWGFGYHMFEEDSKKTLSLLDMESGVER